MCIFTCMQMCVHLQRCIFLDKLVTFLSSVCIYMGWRQLHHVMENKIVSRTATLDTRAVAVNHFPQAWVIYLVSLFHFQFPSCLLPGMTLCAFKNHLLLHLLLLSFQGLVPLEETRAMGDDSVLWNALPPFREAVLCPPVPSFLHAHREGPPWACVPFLPDQLGCKNSLWAEIWQVRAEGGKAIWK